LQWRTPSAGLPMIPAAQELDVWAVKRLKQLKEKTPADTVWDAEIPRNWQHAMNHLYHQGHMIGVHGTACKFPTCEGADTFFQVSSVGPDYVTDIPFARWDHSEYYDPSPDSWRNNKTYCRHAGLMEGIDLFDCKTFSMAPNEAKSMDPHQRMVLEMGYTSLYNMGKRRNTLLNSSCGVYVGCGNNDWSLMPRTQDFGAFEATGSALSIAAGRFSFTFGLKGPSMTLDTEAASGATAIYLAADSLRQKGKAPGSDFAVGIGACLNLSALWWPSYCASKWLSPTGRCLTFDTSASGYVRSDGCAAVALKCLTQTTDAESILQSEDHSVGVVSGAMMNCNGTGASFHAPHGPAEQEVMVEAIRNAGISPFDVDGVEAFGAGTFIADAVEVGSLLRAHRGGNSFTPLGIAAVKSSVGNQVEVTGMNSFLKTMYAAQRGTMTPNLHLRVANPHIEAFEQPCLLATESLEHRIPSTFNGVMARGLGGTNVYFVTWGQLDQVKVPPVAVPRTQEFLSFWPGGGGALENEQLPARNYTIVGSWSQWPDPMPMEAEADGTYSYTLALGENRWEHFEIWLDGDSTKVLHPGKAMAGKDLAVYGPVQNAGGCGWKINGLPELVYAPAADSLQDEWEADDGFALPTADTGSVGDLYRVTLHVAGRWRTVSWQKLPESACDLKVLQTTCIGGQYYVSGDWDGWQLHEMLPEPSMSGFFFQDITLQQSAMEFQIVRNRDWRQVLYPSEPRTTNSTSTVHGPDDLSDGLHWLLHGNPGDTYRIELQRLVTGELDTKKVTWWRLDSRMRTSSTPKSKDDR